jgi:hypothetical protein
MSSAQSSTENPQGTLQGADHYSFRVGDIEITSLSDGSVPQDLHVLLRNTTNQHTDQLLHDAFQSNPVEASINAFFFRTAGKAVTITYDVDMAKAATVRREAFADFAKHRTLIAVPHIPFPGVGHIKVSAQGYEWVPVLYQNRDFSNSATFADPHKNGDK